jgi:hypothetical protein
MEITTEYNSWYIILCAVLAGLYTFFLYGRNKQNTELPRAIVQLLGGLRFVTVFILALLLLNPLMQKWITKTSQPIIIFAQDVSASIKNNADSVYYGTQYVSEIEAFNEELRSNFRVVQMTFGADVNFQDTGITFQDKRTNYAKVFDEIEARYAGDNIGALIFASDGLFNVGAHPDYYNFKQQYPIYTIGLGDSTVKSDIAIIETRVNDIVYLGNNFPVEVSVTSDLLNGKKAKLEVWHKNKVIETRELEISKEQQYFSEYFVFEAVEEGTQRYVFKLTPFENEFNTINNSAQVLIDVLDNRDKILILGNAPHPDIAALRNVLAPKENFQVEVGLANDFEKSLDGYNLIITHGFGTSNHKSLWRQIWNSKVPIWNITYGKLDVRNIVELSPGFEIKGGAGRDNRISPALNTEFNAFKWSEGMSDYFSEVPPLYSPYAEINSLDVSQIYLYQQLGNVRTHFPLVYFNERNNVKTAWQFGEGIWRWKMYDYQENESTEHFNEYIWKIVQYLSVKEDKSRFRVKTAKHFAENQNVKIEAEFYNKSYELVNEADVKLIVKDQNENQFDYIFTPFKKSYQLDLGKLSPGIYAYEAHVAGNSNTEFTKKGSFIVKPVNVEWTKVNADFTVLDRLSNNSGGQFFLPSELDKLRTVFQDQSAFPSISYTSEKKQSLLHEKWIFFAILLLLTIEWLGRKYKGRY